MSIPWAEVRRELLRLADLQEDIAAGQARGVPYWLPYPSSVAGHRAAARALRADAERFLRRDQDEGVAA
jgi:hypothetical protein